MSAPSDHALATKAGIAEARRRRAASGPDTLGLRAAAAKAAAVDPYGPPAVKTPHPADVAAARHERAFVEAKRAVGVSWFNIARMMGRAESDLRQRYAGQA